MRQHAPRIAAQRGFVLPTAIFLLVVLATLAVYMTKLARTSYVSSALDVHGARAYQAARAGIEWTAWQVNDPQGLQPQPTPCPASPTNLTLAGTLAAFTVTVECERNLYADGASTVAVYRVTSTASAGVAGEIDYVERRIAAVFAK